MAINKRSVWITSTFILVGALGVSQDTASVFAQGASKPGPDALKRRAPLLPIPKPVLPKPPVLPAKPGKPTPPPVVEAPQPKTSGLDRWVESTPDALLSAAVRRVEANADDAVAGLLLAASMHEFASPGDTLKALNAIARGKSSAAVDAAGLVAALTPAPFGKTWTGWASAPLDVADDANGFVRAVTVFGPFGDTGGGLPLHEGPEQEGGSFADAEADYSWGDFEVKPRRVVTDWVTGGGVPLDLYISPRQESCTYVASRVSFPGNPGEVVLRVASTGSARVIWDGVTLVSDEHVNARAMLDRFAISIEPQAGDHLLAVKTCSTALADEGRVRMRFTDASGAPLKVAASSDLKRLPKDRASGIAATPKADEAAKPAKDKAKPALSIAPKKPSGGASQPAPPPIIPRKPITSGPPKFGVQKTLLNRALENESLSNEHAITAAIVRSYGGADDTRSPKVTGLLDRITKDASVSDNQLALAGWLSNFGANKSAWLNLAMERAAAKSDSSTVSFAQRRLAEALLAGGAQDAAMRVLEREPLSKENDVSAQVLRASLIGRTRSTLDAYQALANLDLEMKQRIPIVALRELAGVANSNPEARTGYLRRLAQVSVSARGDALVWAASLDGNLAYERAVSQVIPYLANPRPLVGWAATLERRGRAPWAREAAFVATRIAPNLPETWEALASAREAVMLDEQANSKPATDDARFAARARERALALRRGDAGKKAEIAFRDGVFDGKTSTVKEKGADEAYLVEPSVIVERARKSPAKVGEAFERHIHYQRIVTYNDDQRVSQLIHQAREIVVEPRTQQDLYESRIPAEGDEVELLFARVHRKDGTVAQPEEQSSVGAYIKWPQLRTGDIVEYAVRSWISQPVGRRGDPPFYFIDYVGSTSTRPVLFNEVVVVSPEGAQLGVDVINGKADRTSDRIEKGKRVIVQTWDNPPIIAEEPMSPAPTENLPIVIGSTFRSWEDFRSWYRGAIEGFTEPDEQVKRLAAELTKGKKSEQEKLEALFNYVADDIRYVNYVSAEDWLPNRPQVCLSLKKGDCDDKAILLISLLRAVGITATPVLVQTRMTGMPSVLAGKTAAAPLFDHGIAFLPGKAGSAGTWLDATSPESRLGPLPSMDARAKALFIYEGDAKIIDTPPGNLNDNGVTLNWEVNVDAQGGATIKGSENHLGDWAFELRRNLKEEGARAQYVESYLSRWLPTLDLAPGITYSPDTGKLGYSVKTEDFARNEGDEWSIQTLGSYSFMANYASLSTRTLPVVLPPYLAPGHQRRSLTINLPAGFAWKSLPPGGEAKGGAFGTAKVNFKPGRGSRSITIETEVIFDKSTIPVSDYPAFRKWLESVDALIRQSARFVAEPAAGKPGAAKQPGAKPATGVKPAATK